MTLVDALYSQSCSPKAEPLQAIEYAEGGTWCTILAESTHDRMSEEDVDVVNAVTQKIRSLRRHRQRRNAMRVQQLLVTVMVVTAPILAFAQPGPDNTAPEPATLALLGIGAAALIVSHVIRRK